ncbi:hypothetical protein [Neisseria dentiae]|uniref:hypothetical protein n=1 Tax=Neisseria dentiae TaxID=194197 RepID=UPI0035A01045
MASMVPLGKKIKFSDGLRLLQNPACRIRFDVFHAGSLHRQRFGLQAGGHTKPKTPQSRSLTVCIAFVTSKNVTD